MTKSREAGSQEPGAVGVAEDSDPQHLLWRDLSILGIRETRATAARRAVRRVLETRPLLEDGGAEYFELDDYLDDYLEELEVRLGAPFAQRLSSDPYAYSWSRVAFELVGALVRDERLPRVAAALAAQRGESSPRSLLAAHLLELKRLVLGAAVLGGRSITFRTPLPVAEPLAIPGTPLTVIPPAGGSASIEGALDGMPFGPGELRFEECPVVRRGAVEIRLQPYSYGGVPGVEFASDVLATGLPFQRRNVPRLEKALGLVERHQPATFEQLGKHLRIVAFKDPTPGAFTNNITHTDVPGAFVASTVRNPYYLADVLIHEFHHNRLSCIEELGSFFAPESSPDPGGNANEPAADDDGEAAAGGGRFASPWRKDLRPMLGIVHGAYVHVPCTRFWIDVLGGGKLDGSIRNLGLDRTLRGHLQLRCALLQIERHAHLSQLGQRVLAGLRQGEADLASSIRAAGLPEDAQVTRCDPDGTVQLVTHDDGSPLLGREAVRDHFAALGAEDVAHEALAAGR